ncbi:MAG: MFS transporter [Deltaproteobacteria bacterium]|nr:MFS transporter [Deltaproteobacteria bacterium]
MYRRINWLLLANAMLGSFLSGTASRIFNISMPTVASSLGTDLIGISWALLAYQLSNIGLSLVFGRIGDVYGREKVYGTGFAVFSLASLLCGLSQNVLQLILFRVLQGIAAAMFQSSGRALAAEAVPEELGGRAQAYMTTAFHSGFLLGPSIGGLIIDYLHWRWTFFSLVPIGMLGILLTLKSPRHSVAPHRRQPVDYPGAVLLVISMIALIGLFDRRITELLGTWPKGALILTLIGSFSGFVVRESRISSPIVSLRMFKIRMFTLSSLSLVMVSICYSLTGFLLPFYLQEVLHLSPSAIGFLFVVPPIMTVSLAPLSGRLTDRVGPRLPTSLGVVALALSLLVGVTLKPDSHWLLPTFMLWLGGIANGIFNPANSVGMISPLPKEHMGFGSAAHHVMFSLGNIFGIALGGFLMTTAFEFYTGIPGVTATTENPHAFVAALTTTYLVALGLSLIALVASAMIGSKVQSHTRAVEH